MSNMTTYKIQEVENFHSIREPTIIHASSLQGAKNIATKNQVFYGTVLKIFSANDTLLAYSTGGTAKWKSY